jgi:dephospho-CoA kinase
MPKNKKIIGLTGNIASGKSTVARYLEKKGFFVIYADKLTNDLYEYDLDFFNQIVLLFGENILTDGKIDKRKIGNIVFNDQKKMFELEKIIHPKVLEMSLAIMENNDDKIIIFEVPLLYEADYDKKCDKVIFVSTDKDLQLKRLMKRNHLCKNDALARINSQVEQDKKSVKADYVINNNGDLEDLYDQVDFIINEIKKR